MYFRLDVVKQREMWEECAARLGVHPGRWPHWLSRGLWASRAAGLFGRGGGAAVVAPGKVTWRYMEKPDTRGPDGR